MIIERRTFLCSFLAAPAIVAASSLMPIRGLIMPIEPLPDWIGELVFHIDYDPELIQLLNLGTSYRRLAVEINHRLAKDINGQAR